MIDFTSRQLRAFLLVAQHQSFSRAAEALFITPSGLSLLIRELENQLGFRLFNRTTRHVSLAADGSQLLPVARRNLEELESLVSRMGKTAKEVSRGMSVGSGTLFAANILPQAIRHCRLYRPDIKIRVFDADGPAIVQKIQSGTLDMGLGWVHSTAGIKRTPIFRWSMMVIRPEMEGASRPTS